MIKVWCEVKRELEKKDYGEATEGVTVAFRFPSGKVDKTFLSTASVKVSSLRI